MSTPTMATEYPRKLRVIEATYWPHHRSGWRIALCAITDHLHAPDGIAFISYVDGCILDNTPIKEPWVGFLHGPVHFSETDRLLVGRDCGLDALLETESWQRLAPLCQGLFALSTYTRNFIAGREAIPVSSLLHPAETVDRVFTFDKFLANPDKKLLHVGWWGRRVQSLYDLPATRYQKVWLRGTPGDYSRVPLITNPTVRVLERVSNDEYDRLLEANLVFLDFHDTAANNTVVECIVRHTPLLVRKLAAVVEYLGDDYPFYYDSLDEAAAKAQDWDLIRATTHYLRNSPIQEKLTPEYFLQSLVQSVIYQRLLRAEVSVPARIARVAPSAGSLGPSRKPRLLFCSYHCYGDPSSGAALCTRDLLEILTARGWKCGVFCGPHLDFEDGASLDRILGAQQLSFERRPATVGTVPFALVHYEQGGIPVTIYDLPNTRPYQLPTRAEGQVFLGLFERVLEKVRPDVLLTYGGYWLAEGVMARAKQQGIPVVFFLLNCAYQDAGRLMPCSSCPALPRRITTALFGCPARSFPVR